MKTARFSGCLIVLGLLLAFPCAGQADIIDVTVQDITFKMSDVTEPDTTENVFNKAKSWIDDDSDHFVTGILDKDDNTKIRGIAIEPYSAYHTHQVGGNPVKDAPYFGGMMRFTEHRIGSTTLSPFPPANREVTGIFYGLEFALIDPGPGIAVKPDPTDGTLNLVFDQGSTLASEYSFDVYFSGGSFKLYVDDDPNFPLSAPNFKNVNLKDGSDGGNTDWQKATDNAFSDVPLLTGDFKSTTFTLKDGVKQVSYEAKGTVTVKTSTGSDPLYSVQIHSQEYVNAGGALAAYLDPFGDPQVFGWFESTNILINDPFRDIVTVVADADWVGHGGTTYLDALGQDPSTYDVEYFDESSISMNLQTPLPTAAVFMAPALFGFLGFSVRRRRRKR